jgi:hypothetical protein
MPDTRHSACLPFSSLGACYCQCDWLRPYQKCCLPALRSLWKPIFCAPNMFSISFSVLDGKNLAEYVRIVPRWAQMYIFDHVLMLMFNPAVNFALYLILESNAYLQKPRKRKIFAAIGLMTFATVVFRSELILLLAPLTLQFLFLGYINLSSVLKVGLISGILSVGSYHNQYGYPHSDIAIPSSHHYSRFIFLGQMAHLARVCRPIFQRI